MTDDVSSTELPVILREHQRLIHANNALHQASIEREVRWEAYRAEHSLELRQWREKCHALAFALRSATEESNVAELLEQAVQTVHKESDAASNKQSEQVQSYQAALVLRQSEIKRLTELIESNAPSASTLLHQGQLSDLRLMQRKLESRIEFLVQDKAKSDQLLSDFERKGTTKSASLQIEARDRKIKELEKDVKRVEKEKHELHQRCQKLELESFMSTEQNLEQENKQHENLSQTQRSLEKSRQEIAQLRAQLLSAQSERSQLHLDYQSKMKQLELAYDERFHVTEMTNELAKLKKDRDRLQALIEKSGKELLEAEATALLAAGRHETATELLERTIKERDATIKNLRAELDASETSARASKLQLETASNELTQLRRTVTHAQEEAQYWKQRSQTHESDLRSQQDFAQQNERLSRDAQDEASSLRSQLEQMRTEYDRTVTDNHRLSIKLREQEQQSMQQERELALQKSQLTAYQSSSAQARQRSQELVESSTHDGARLQLSQQLIAEQNEAVETMRQELQHAQQRTQAYISENQTLCTMISALDEQLLKCGGELREYLTAAARQDAVQANLRLELDKSRAQVNSGLEKLQRAEEEARQAARTLLAAESEKQALTTTIEQHITHSQAHSKEMEALRERVQALETQLEAGLERENSTQAKCVELEKKWRTSHLNAGALERQAASAAHERGLLEERVRQLQSQVRDLGTLIQQMDALNQERDAELRAGTETTAELQAQAAAHVQQLEAAHAAQHDAQQRAFALETLVHEAKGECLSLQRELDHERAQLEQQKSMTGALEADIKALHERLQERNKEHEELAAELARERQQYRTLNSASHSVTLELEASLKDTGVLLNENAMLARRCAQLEEACREASRAHDSALVQQAVQEQQAQISGEQASALHADRRALGLQVDRLQLLVSDYEAKIGRLMAESQLKQQELDEARLTMGEQRASLEHASQEADDLRAQHASMSTALHQLRADVEQSAQHSQHQQQQQLIQRHLYQASESERANAIKQVANLQQSMHLLQDELHKKDRQIQAQQQEHKVLQERISSLELLLAQQRRERSSQERSHQEQLEQANQTVHELLQERDRQRKRLDDALKKS